MVTAAPMRAKAKVMTEINARPRRPTRVEVWTLSIGSRAYSEVSQGPKFRDLDKYPLKFWIWRSTTHSIMAHRKRGFPWCRKSSNTLPIINQTSYAAASVIGVNFVSMPPTPSFPLTMGFTVAPVSYGGLDWDAGFGDGREDSSRVFRSEEDDQGDLPRAEGFAEGCSEDSAIGGD